MQNSGGVLRARELSKRFGARRVFGKLNFEVEHGAAVAVVGANGSGKSTLLRIICGLERPSSGSLEWCSESDSEGWSGAEMRLLCGLSAPDAPLPRELSVLENLEFVAQVRGVEVSRQSLLEHLAQCGLERRTHDLAGDLSSGLRARLGLAISTVHAPTILLLDEPGANLDEAGREITQRVLETQRKRGITLLATNDNREAQWCDARIEL